jgi:DNA-binding GntR family transcriptional regulator
MTDGAVSQGLTPLADRSLADQAYEALREAILDLRLKPGAALVEQKLAAALGTSKTPIRQALHRLEQTGLVRAMPGRGYSVAPLSLRDAQEILQIRAALEGLATELACARLSESNLDDLRGLLRAAEEAHARGDEAQSVGLGHRFHQALIDSADNERLTFLIGVLSDQYRRVRLVSNQNLARVPRSIQEHAAVFRALEARDAAGAGQEMRQHLLAVYDDLRRDGSLTEQLVSPD